MFRFPLRVRLMSCFLLAGSAAVPAAGAPAPVDLPLEAITLFSSGVGYFRHAGPVPAGGEVTLDFTADELNDVLKSLSLSGAGGGASVSYPGQADLDQRLSGFGVDLRGVASRYDLLARLRGVAVRVGPAGGGAEVTGRVLGVETRAVPAADGGRDGGRDSAAVAGRFVTLATERGLAELALDQIDRLEVADARLAGEMAAALELLAGARDTRKKPVTLRFHDAAERVGVGYLRASPLWKLSYRLDLSGLAENESGSESGSRGDAQLQGWAVIDNTTDRDWAGVAVTLVSGRPVSFVQDLYTPEFLRRPVVRPERFAGLTPQRYDQDTGEAASAGAALSRETAGRVQKAGRQRALVSAPQAEGLYFAQAGGYGGAAVEPVAAAATAGAVGELFAYTLSEPVTLGRGDSAMLPVVQDAVNAQALSVFNDRVHAQHPLRGVRLTNTTALKLDAGPVTVLDGGTYAGDAQLGFLAPGARRLLTYALDLEVVVDAQDRQRTVQTGGRLERGVLVLGRRQEIRRTYALKNTADRGRHVLIEHVRNPSFELIDPPAGLETTGGLYRLPVEVPAGKTVTLTATQVRTSEQVVKLGGLDAAQLLARAQGGALPPGVVARLKEAAALRRAVAEAERELALTTAARDRIVEEQTRLRDNMKALDRNSALYRRYLEKLNTQEDELDALRARRAAQDAGLGERRAAFEAYIAGLG